MELNTDLRKIHMVDLQSQYSEIKAEIDEAIQQVLNQANYINGKQVQDFVNNLSSYLNSKFVIPCANGTDALQIALMALDLEPGSEIITPGFSYIAVAEVCELLKLKPVFAEVDIDTFNINPLEIEKLITPKTKVIVPVHLFGQSAEMEMILAIAEKHNLYVIEDNAQSIGADYTFSNGRVCKTGTMGHIGTTSFFPSKNLGCYGDGGAITTQDEKLAERIKMIANHGQKIKYIHDEIGVNSRLDTIQASILNVKLKHLDAYNQARRDVAMQYSEAFKGHSHIKPPRLSDKSTHVFHQYTMQLCNTNIAELKQHLTDRGIPSMVYYPLPLYKQKAYSQNVTLPISEMLSATVLSLPMGTHMDNQQINYIIKNVLDYFKK